MRTWTGLLQAEGEKWPDSGAVLEAWTVGHTNELDKEYARDSAIRDESLVMQGEVSG